MSRLRIRLDGLSSLPEHDGCSYELDWVCGDGLHARRARGLACPNVESPLMKRAFNAVILDIATRQTGHAVAARVVRGINAIFQSVNTYWRAIAFNEERGELAHLGCLAYTNPFNLIVVHKVQHLKD